MQVVPAAAPIHVKSFARHVETGMQRAFHRQRIEVLDVVELVMALEEKFEVEIPDSEAEKLVSIQDVVNYIEKLGK